VSVAAPKILLTVLWQRTSERGSEYLSGFLSRARVIGFRGEPTADGIPTWDLYLQPGKEQEERATHGRGQPPPSACAATSLRPDRVRRRTPEANPGPPHTFFDDDISDVGRGR
jgi:hypothetical protein